MHAYYVPGTGRGKGDMSVNQTHRHSFHTSPAPVLQTAWALSRLGFLSRLEGRPAHGHTKPRVRDHTGKQQLSQSLPSRLPFASYWPEVSHMVTLAAKESGRWVCSLGYPKHTWFFWREEERWTWASNFAVCLIVNDKDNDHYH